MNFSFQKDWLQSDLSMTHALLSLQVYSKPFQHKYLQSNLSSVLSAESKFPGHWSIALQFLFTVHYSLFKHGSSLESEVNRLIMLKINADSADGEISIAVAQLLVVMLMQKRLVIISANL